MDEENIPKTKAQQETERKLAQGQEQSDANSQPSYYTGEDGDKNSGAADKAAQKGASGGISKLATSSNPAGRIAGAALGFLKSHKKGSITGVGILATLIGLFTLLVTISAPATAFLGVSSMMQDFNFGPGDSAVTRQFRRMKTNLGTIRSSGNDTQLQQTANEIEDVDRAQEVPDRNGRRAQRRFNFRSLVSGRSTAHWRGVFRSSDDADGRASRRMYGRDRSRQRSTVREIDGVADEDELREIQESEEPDRQARRSGARFARGASVVVTVVGMGCALSAIEDLVPDEGEMYELLLEQQANWHASSSQLADGETADPDQVADLWGSLNYTEEGLQPAEGTESGLSDEEREVAEELKQEWEELEDEGVDNPEEVLADRHGSISIGDVELETAEQIRSFSHSAAYKRIANHEVTGNEMDYEMSFGYQDELESGWSGVFLTGGSIVNDIPGLRGTCRAAMSPVGIIALYGADIALSAGACKVTLGAGCGVRVGLGIGVSELASRLIMRAILLTLFDSLAPEGPEEMFAYTDMGSNMAESEHARNQGAPPASNQETNARRAAYLEDLADQDRERGFAWRYLSPQNHRSVFTQVAISMESFRARNLLKPFTNLSATISSSISRTIPNVSAQEEFNNYEIEQYIFSEEVLASVSDVEGIIENDQKMSAIEGYSCSAANGGFEDGAGNSCDIGRWNDARLMEVIIDECIENTYPEHIENDWEYEYEQVRASGGGFEEYENEIDCSGDLTSRERSFWEQVGVWRLNKGLMANLKCLSHDDPCGASPEESEDDRDGGGELPAGTDQELAQQIIESPNVTGDPRYMGQIQRVANGQAPCSKEGAYLSETVLGLILAMSEDYSFYITSINRYCTGVLTSSGTDSYHWAQGGGRAVDFDNINGNDIITPQSRDLAKRFAEEAAQLLPSGSGIGQSQCNLGLTLPGGIRHFTDACNHLHIEVSS